jgi:hypothetical protein
MRTDSWCLAWNHPSHCTCLAVAAVPYTTCCTRASPLGQLAAGLATIRKGKIRGARLPWICNIATWARFVVGARTLQTPPTHVSQLGQLGAHLFRLATIRRGQACGARIPYSITRWTFVRAARCLAVAAVPYTTCCTRASPLGQLAAGLAGLGPMIHSEFCLVYRTAHRGFDWQRSGSAVRHDSTIPHHRIGCGFNQTLEGHQDYDVTHQTKRHVYVVRLVFVRYVIW